MAQGNSAIPELIGGGDAFAQVKAQAESWRRTAAKM